MNIRNQSGVSLIESMIALLVISIGLLGIAALQVTAMGQNTSALNHSRAVWIANDMADRVRSNVTVFATYGGILTSGSYSQDCQTNGCTNAQMVTADAEDFATEVGALPAGLGRVTADAAQTTLTIDVMWDDEGTGASGTACGNNPNVDLTCYTVVVVQ